MVEDSKKKPPYNIEINVAPEDSVKSNIGADTGISTIS
mgnify:CR=1 FL=1